MELKQWFFVCDERVKHELPAAKKNGPESIRKLSFTFAKQLVLHLWTSPLEHWHVRNHLALNK